ncbi:MULTISPECIES: glutathione S-transferase N-terminal domain-containing protein [Rhizobium]|uniref:Glutathione S-transferase n=1 Tax=Rhizobium paranaense TaxID=1650438 RepID=A0A7W8XUA5_9HYPH|nr:glutathione S-transferase N-terminal domain-containing protein [Rhizobium paranaense]MBB5575621.1 glutathione S-transferase [Rhizobium paranaense]
MSENASKPVLYFKKACPFCLKVRLFLWEARMMEEVEIRECEPGSKQESDIRAELAGHLDKVSFPAARLEPGRYIADSGEIIALLAAKSGCVPADMPVLASYIEGALKPMMKLWKENLELKAAAA